MIRDYKHVLYQPKSRLGEFQDKFKKSIYYDIVRNDDLTGFLSLLSRKGNFIGEKIGQYSLLDMSAIFNAVDIFKFLFKNDLPITSKTVKCAILSESVDILSIIESSLDDLGKYLSMAVQFNRNDVADWIMANFEHKMFTFKDTIIGSNLLAFLYLHDRTDYVERLYPKLMLLAAQQDSLPIVTFLLERGVSLNRNKYGVPLAAAMHNVDSEIVPFMVDQGADISDLVVIEAALAFNNIRFLKILIMESSDISSITFENGKNMLHHVTSLAATKLLILHKVDVNKKADNNITPLMSVICNENIDPSAKYGIVECLISNGAEIDIETTNHETALCHAIHHELLDVVKILVKNNARRTKAVQNFMRLSKNNEIVDYVKKFCKHPKSKFCNSSETLSLSRITA